MLHVDINPWSFGGHLVPKKESKICYHAYDPLLAVRICFNFHIGIR